MSGGALAPQRQREFARLGRLFAAGLPVPRPFFCRMSPDGEKVGTLLSWIEGEPLEAALPRLTEEERYRAWQEAGAVLRRIQGAEPAPTAPSWRQRYLAAMEPRFAAYRQRGEPFAGRTETLAFLEACLPLLEERPQTPHHGDYHPGNLIRRADGGIPPAFWRLFAFYQAASALCAIVWAKERLPQELPGLLAWNEALAAGQRERPDLVPAWYREMR